TPASIEFGDAAGNSTFDIGNSGNAPLEIRKVAVAESPGFSATDVGPKTLQPGEHVSVTVSYQPDGKRHQAFGGVQIFSNDDRFPSDTRATDQHVAGVALRSNASNLLTWFIFIPLI